MKNLIKWWYFHVKNPVVRAGESGGFIWRFRRFWLEIETKSGNFKAKYMADEHPYAYLLAGLNDDNIIGFCQMVYVLSHTLTTDQRLVNDVKNALARYEKRLEASVKVEEDETEEKIALETEKAIQEHVELPKKQRRKAEREIDKRFKKAAKDVELREKGRGGDKSA